MRLEIEGKPSVDDVSPSKVKTTIARLKSYGPSSFASLTDENGDYIQVAGGRVTCMMERRVAESGAHFRAYQNKRSEVFEDGTLLVFGGGKIAMHADEWFNATDVEEVFLAFLERRDLPERIRWRDVTHTLK